MFYWDVRAGEARALQAGSWQNPELDVRFYRLGIPRAGREPDERRTRVILSQVFELGCKARKRKDLAELESNLAGWDYEAKRIEVATSVAARFVAVLGAQRRVESLQRFTSFLEQVQERVAVMVETGSMRSLETHQIKRQVGLAKIELHRAEGELATARFRLAATWGSQSPKFAQAVGDLEQIGEVPDIETVIELAQQSPLIARWDVEYERGEAARAVAKSRRVPDLTAGVGIRWEQYASTQDYLLDFEIDLPFVDRKKGEIRQAESEMARAQAGKKAAEAASSESIAEFYYLMEAAKERSLTLGNEVVPAARAMFDAVRLGFETDAETLGSLVDAGRDQARAEVEYTEALVEYHQALSTLEGIVGQGLVD
jgi:cobalt-zinc-cadmium efflux system outer membrane protein